MPHGQQFVGQGGLFRRVLLPGCANAPMRHSLSRSAAIKAMENCSGVELGGKCSTASLQAFITACAAIQGSLVNFTQQRLEES